MNSADFFNTDLRLASQSHHFKMWLKQRPSLARQAPHERDALVLRYLQEQVKTLPAQRLPYTDTPLPPIVIVLPELHLTYVSAGSGSGGLPSVFDFSRYGNARRVRIDTHAVVIADMEVYFERPTDDIDAYRLLPSATPGSTNPLDYLAVLHPEIGPFTEFDSMTGMQVAAYPTPVIDYVMHNKSATIGTNCVVRVLYV